MGEPIELLLSQQQSNKTRHTFILASQELLLIPAPFPAPEGLQHLCVDNSREEGRTALYLYNTLQLTMPESALHCALGPNGILRWQMREPGFFCFSGSSPAITPLPDSPGGTSDLPNAHMLCLSRYNTAQRNTRENCVLCLPFFHETRKHRRAKWKHISVKHKANSVCSAPKWQHQLFSPDSHCSHPYNTSLHRALVD